MSVGIIVLNQNMHVVFTLMCCIHCPVSILGYALCSVGRVSRNFMPTQGLTTSHNLNAKLVQFMKFIHRVINLQARMRPHIYGGTKKYFNIIYVYVLVAKAIFYV